MPGTARRDGRTRGVTLIELMIVVAIIGLFAVLAAPSLSSALADRNVSHATNEASGMFRVARTRSAATGGAHMIRATAVGVSTRFELRMAVNTATGAAISSCTQTTWSAAGTDNRLLSVLDTSTDPAYLSQGVQVLSSGGTASSGGLGDFCYTPQGTAWWSTGSGWKLANAGDYLQYTVQRTTVSGAQIGMQRVILIGALGSPKVVAK